MPSLSDARNADLTGYAPASGAAPAPPPPAGNLQPNLNAMLRCPLPPIWQTSPDSLRQFYLGGQVPQARLLSPANAPLSSGSSTTTNSASVTTVIVNGSQASTPSSVASGIGIQQSVAITEVLGPGGSYRSSIPMAKGFQLLGISTSAPARVQLYGSAGAQSADAYRAVDTPPPAGTGQGIICDVVLDTAPFQWAFQNRVGANNESPTTTSVYVTLTNLDTTSDNLTLTVVYVPLES